jgi:hypothetical protein
MVKWLARSRLSGPAKSAPPGGRKRVRGRKRTVRGHRASRPEAKNVGGQRTVTGAQSRLHEDKESEEKHRTFKRSTDGIAQSHRNARGPADR